MRIYLLLSFTLILVLGCNNQEEKNSSNLENPTSENSLYPRLYTDNTGTIFMSWIEQNNEEASLKYSSFSEENWTEPETIYSDSNMFINWADFPSIVANDGKPVAAHWLTKIPGNAYSYNVSISRYQESWSAPVNPHADNTATEHGFVSMLPTDDSDFAVIWLDGRNTAGREHDEYSDPEKAMTLRSAFINGSSGEMETVEIDRMVCDCCNTALAKTEDGFIAAYRNRTENEIRDIYISKYSDGKWSEPKVLASDDWVIAACPVNGPALDVGENVIAAAWFTGAEGKAQVKLSTSTDNGESFSEAIIVSENNALGRVDLEIINNKIWVSWLESIENDGVLKLQSYNFSGEKQNTLTIEGISKNRKSGFPQITRMDNSLMIAYTDFSGEKPIIKTKIVR